MHRQALSYTNNSTDDYIRGKNENVYVQGDQGDLNSVGIVVILCLNKYLMIR